jgi:hypothetical protein
MNAKKHESLGWCEVLNFGLLSEKILLEFVADVMLQRSRSLTATPSASLRLGIRDGMSRWDAVFMVQVLSHE